MKGFRYIIGLSLLSLTVAQPALAQKVCLIRGFDFSIYEQVVKGVKGVWQGAEYVCDVTVKKIPKAQQKIMEENPDVILALGNSAIELAKKTFPSVPIVFGMASQISSQSNLTGVDVEVPYSEQIELTKQAIPNLKRVGVIYSARNSGKASSFIQAAKSHNLSVNSHAVSSPDEVLRIIPKLKDEDLFWLLLDDGVMTVKNRDAILKSTRDLGLTTYVFSPVYLKGPFGADLSVSINWENYGAQIGRLARQVVASPNGAPPIEKPEKAMVYLKKGRDQLNFNLTNAVVVP